MSSKATASSLSAAMLELDTPHGRARVHTRLVDEAPAALVLGHGAGGGIEAPDLVVAAEVARDEGLNVALVEQPYRVAGRRSPAPANQLDGAWTAVLEHLREKELEGLPLITGGRSLGARVACRTAETTGAIGVLCLAFPLQPPRRSGGTPPESRLSELDAVSVPTLVVQGDRDQFGIPPQGKHRTVVTVSGNHSLRTDREAIAAAIQAWLPTIVAGVAGAARKATIR